MTSKNKIVKWDVIQDSCSDILKPMLYFVPTPEDITFINDNDNKVMINVTDCDEFGGPYWGTVGKSSNVPNCRPNFFDVTQYYVITLDSYFTNYPKKMGNFTFVTGQYFVDKGGDIQDKPSTNDNNKTKETKETFVNDSSESNIKNNFWIVIIVLILIIFSAILFCSVKNN